MCDGNWSETAFFDHLFTNTTTSATACGTYTAAESDVACEYNDGDTKACYHVNCAGPCTNPKYYHVYTSRSLIEVECSRYYRSRLTSTTCSGETWQYWDQSYPSVNEFEGMETALETSREAAEEKCEQACAMTNNCRAFAVSSNAHYNGIVWKCAIYDSCLTTQSDASYDLYQRLEPYNCFVQATSFDGIFRNYQDTGNILNHFQRKLNIPIKEFQDVHVKVNGVLNDTVFGYRPYNDPPDVYCSSVVVDGNFDIDCIMLNAGAYSIVMFSIFLVIVLYNACMVFAVNAKVYVVESDKQLLRKTPYDRLRNDDKQIEEMVPFPGTNQKLRRRNNNINDLHF